jgi:hypothetical protein
VTLGGLDGYFAELNSALNAKAEPGEIRRIQDDYASLSSDRRWHVRKEIAREHDRRISVRVVRR